tara:strand:- start:225 stop:458 length:234 start_codon:yes stop_codon:yes gene_type:complete
MKYFKLTVSSTEMYDLWIRTPDDINKDDVRMNFKKFDSGWFETDNIGDWEFANAEEIDEEDFEKKSYKCDWEDRYND